MKNHTSVVLITGCSSGIGRAIAEEFNRQNFIVYATARKIETLSELKKDGIHTLTLDVNNEKNIKQAISQIIKEQGKIDVLVNNAGYSSVCPVAEIPLKELRLQFETNILSAINLIQHVVPNMIKKKNGKIVNMGSVSGILTTPFAGAYCSSKASLHALSEALRMELAPFNIKVIIVQPGAIQSNLGNTSKRSVSRNINADSLYRSILDSINKRADYSQQNPTPTTVFAKQLIAELKKENPKKIIRLGKGGFSLPFLKRWIPDSVLDKIMIKKFGLNKLKDE